jgi:hypothetical protein
MDKSGARERVPLHYLSTEAAHVHVHVTRQRQRKPNSYAFIEWRVCQILQLDAKSVIVDVNVEVDVLVDVHVSVDGFFPFVNPP